MDKMQNNAVDEEDDVQLNEEFISWMMLDIESNRGSGNGNGNGNSNISADGDENEDGVSSPETVEKAEGNDGNRITGQKRKVSRSRELAKESRMRQRLKQQETEKRIAELRAENSELQAHLQNVTQRTTEVQRQRLDMERIMADKLRELATMNESNNRELEEILRKFVELYADYGGYRQKEVAFHLGQMEKLFLPTQTTKMLLWTLVQDPKFYEIDTSPLFKSIATELELSPEQIEKIKQKQLKALGFLDQLQECLILIKTLKTSIEKKHYLFDKACGSIMKEAMPRQNVKFLLWITRNTERLSKVIPDFQRSVPHTPQAPILTTLDRNS